MSASAYVREFHEAFDLPVQPRPMLAPPALADLRRNLLDEEYKEYLDAVESGDLVEIADALADMIYVIHGTALTYGVDLDAVVAEVHRSNMSKLGDDGRPLVREDGKVLKGPSYFRPNISGVLGASDV